MILICGASSKSLIDLQPNGKTQSGSPIFNPPLQSSINPSTLKSYSISQEHAVIIKNDDTVYGIGNNQDGRISGSLPKKMITKYTQFFIKDTEGRPCIPRSVVCGRFYSLYLVSDPEDESRSQLAFYSKETKFEFPIVLNIGKSNPVALFGGSYSAAAIDSNGNVIILDSDRIMKSNYTEIPSISPPEGQKAIGIANLDEFLFVLTENGKVYGLTFSEENSTFSEVPELNDIRIIGLSGNFTSCFAVSEDCRVFAFGSNRCHQLGLSVRDENVVKFTEIESLSSQKVAAVYAGMSHSLFMTEEGKILSCGDNRFNQLIRSGGPCMHEIWTPDETRIDKGASFCIAGMSISVVFCGCVPPCMANRVISFK